MLQELLLVEVQQLLLWPLTELRYNMQMKDHKEENYQVMERKTQQKNKV